MKQFVPLEGMKYNADGGTGKASFSPIGLRPANKILQEGYDIVMQIDPTAWLSSGTFLGIYRDDELIHSDTDVDVGVYGQDAEPIEDVLVANGYELVRTADLDGYAIQRAYVKDDVVFDVCFYHPLGEGLVSCCNYGIFVKPSKFFGNNTITYKGKKYNCPDPEPYLEWRYGKDWKTPRYVQYGNLFKGVE